MSLDHYFSALKRLQTGQPKVMPLGTKINNDAVSLEADRKKGSIKKSRSSHAELIAAIEAASEQQCRTPTDEQGAKLEKIKKEVDMYRELYEGALGREQSLVAELFDMKIKLAKLTGENIFPFTKSDQHRP